MNAEVYFSKNAEKDIKKLPRRIAVLLETWVEVIETDGYLAMKKIKGYRDHALKGDRKGQRSSSLTRSWRIIYELDKSGTPLIVDVTEVNHHDY